MIRNERIFIEFALWIQMVQNLSIPFYSNFITLQILIRNTILIYTYTFDTSTLSPYYLFILIES